MSTMSDHDCHHLPGERCDHDHAVSLVPPPLSLYVHLPWCVRKCPYCDFNSHQAKGELPFEAYIDALVRDLDQDLPLVWGRVVNSVFFGGGTPSLFPPEAIDRFLQAASARLRFAPNLEVTLETNPGTAEHGRFDRYRAAGVNRISFGIQTFNDEALQRLGRIHDSGEAERAVKLAQDAGYDNFNIDLMYALPQQTLAQAEHDLDRAFALQPTHLSHYQLTLEPNTVFFARPPQGIPDDDSAWDMQEHCQRLLAEAGYAQYEVSAYARPGRQSQHNLNYWRHGRVDRRRRGDRRRPPALRIHAQPAAPARGLPVQGLRVAHRAGPGDDRRAAADRPRQRLDDRAGRPGAADRAGPALHQRRGGAVPGLRASGDPFWRGLRENVRFCALRGAGTYNGCLRPHLHRHPI